MRQESIYLAEALFLMRILEKKKKIQTSGAAVSCDLGTGLQAVSEEGARLPSAASGPGSPGSPGSPAGPGCGRERAEGCAAAPALTKGGDPGCPSLAPPGKWGGPAVGGPLLGLFITRGLFFGHGEEAAAASAGSAPPRAMPAASPESRGDIAPSPPRRWGRPPGSPDPTAPHPRPQGAEPCPRCVTCSRGAGLGLGGAGSAGSCPQRRSFVLELSQSIPEEEAAKQTPPPAAPGPPGPTYGAGGCCNSH